MTRDVIMDWRVQDVAKDIVETHAQATPRDWGAPDHALYKLIVAKLVAERDRIAALSRPALPDDLARAVEAVLDYDDQHDTLHGTGLAEMLRAALAAPAPVAAPAGPPAGFECCDPRGGAEGCCRRYVSVAALVPVGESPLAHAAVEATARAHGWDAESDTLAGWLHTRLSVAAPAPKTPAPDAMPCPECLGMPCAACNGTGRRQEAQP